MPTGVNAYLRCGRCQKAPDGRTYASGGFLRVADHCFKVQPTGRTKTVERYGYRRHVILTEYRCARGHVFWTNYDHRRLTR